MGRNQIPSDQASFTTEASFSTNTSLPSSQQIVVLRKLLARARRLPNQLWSPKRSGSDYTALAGTLTQLSLTFSQLVSVLNKDNAIPSAHAWQDVTDMAHQCDSTFDYIEQNVIGTERTQRQLDDMAVQSIEANVTAKEVECLGALLLGIAATMGVMTQVCELAQAKVGNRYYTMDANEHVEEIRQMAHSLVFQQQISLLKASKLVRQLQLQANTPQPIRQRPISPGSSVDSNYFGSSPSSATLSLAKFQERNMLPSLFPSFSTPSAAFISSTQTTEQESMALIKRMASTKVDELLHKWTNLDRFLANEDDFDDEPIRNLSGSLNMVYIGANRRRLTDGSIMSQEELERRRSLQPFVESDDEEIESRSSQRYIFGNPVLEAIGEQHQEEAISPRSFPAMPVPTTRPSEMSRTISSPTYFPSGHPSSVPHSAGHRPIRHQSYPYSTSIPLSQQHAQQWNRHETESIASSSSLSASSAEIAWRLRLDQSYWRFKDNVMVHTNTQLPLEEALRNKRTVTELHESCVIPEVLFEKHWLYRVMPGDRSKRKSRESMVRIEKPLRWLEVKDIVDQSRELMDRKDRDRNFKVERKKSFSASLPCAPTERDLRERLREDYDLLSQKSRESGRRDGRSSNHGYNRPKVERRYSNSQRDRRDSKQEREYREDKERKGREKSREPTYVGDDEDGYTTDKTPRARSRGRGRRESESRRNDRYDDDDEYDDDGRRRRSSSARRGSFMEAAKHATKVLGPAAGMATLVVQGLASLS